MSKSILSSNMILYKGNLREPAENHLHLTNLEGCKGKALHSKISCVSINTHGCSLHCYLWTYDIGDPPNFLW